MLASPSHAVIGARSPGPMVEFLVGLGFEQASRGTLPAPAASALYGLEGEVAEVRLAVPGAASGWLRVVETPHPAPHAGPFDRGPHAIDLYTRDMARSLELAARGGGKVGEVGRYQVGPIAIAESKVIGPEGLAVVFLEASRRRPSVLDTHPDRLHSELHSVVFAVDRVEEALPFFRDEAGLGPYLDATVREPAVARFMNLPRPDTPLRLVMLADARMSPSRLELLEFPEDPGRSHETGVLRAGLHAACFCVPDLDAARAALGGARFGSEASLDTPVHGAARAVAGAAPGGVPLELWQER
jgi:hypothetical protein